jgi:hypothetical protein
MVVTTPSSPTMEMYSPIRKGLVKMIESPATTLLNTPWVASATPAPATPRPAISGSSSTPRFCSARITNRENERAHPTLANNVRTGGSSST